MIRLCISFSALLATISPALPCSYSVENPDETNTNVARDFLYAFENQSSLKFIENCYRIFPKPNHHIPKLLEGYTPLLISLNRKPSAWQDQAVAWLISKGADVNMPDSFGQTPLMAAAQYANPATVTRLLKAGARVKDVNKDGATALHMTPMGNCKVIPLLLKAGVPINAQANDGATALLVAVNARDVECVKLLIAARADVNLSDKYGTTPLMEASKKGTDLFVANTSKNRTTIAKALIEAKADIHAVTPEGVTALLFAAATGDTETVRLLLMRGADKTAADAKGRNALYYAQKNKHKAIVELLSN